MTAVVSLTPIANIKASCDMSIAAFIIANDADTVTVVTTLNMDPLAAVLIMEAVDTGNVRKVFDVYIDVVVYAVADVFAAATDITVAAINFTTVIVA